MTLSYYCVVNLHRGGVRPKVPAVIVPVFGPIRHSCVVQDRQGCVRCPADDEAGLCVWTNKGKAGLMVPRQARVWLVPLLH